MLKTMVASKAAKLMAACVCPVVGSAALTVSVPQVREAVHKATAPRQYAKPKTRVRKPAAEVAAAAIAPCPTAVPVVLSSLELPTGGDTVLPPLDFASLDPKTPFNPLRPTPFLPRPGGGGGGGGGGN
ncbi:MAG: PEP-CTERM sorting domain-containing protein, partial [Sphingomonadaceae bacterium]